MGGLGRGIPVLWILEDLLIQNITPKALKKKKRAEGWLITMEFQGQRGNFQRTDGG